ncbi:MAG: regulatory protein RecX [Clostridia bacterium]
MVVVTAKRGRGDKVHVYADGEYLVTVDQEFWYSEGIRPGSELDPEQVESFRQRAAYRRAYNKGLSILSYAPKSRRALIERLMRDEIPREQAEQAADKLEEYGFLNDADYASLYAEELLRNKNLSARGAVAKLIAKGVERELAQEAVAALAFDEEAGIEELLRGKLSYFNRSPRDWNRAAAALARRGYGYSDVRRVMERLNQELDDGEVNDEL